MVSRWMFPVALFGLVACRADAPSAGATVSVFAASSLTEAFEALEPGFEAANPGLDVQLVFAGSQVLRLQIEHGAAADVFASADVRHLDALAEAGRARDVQAFAHNRLAIIVPPDNPAGVEGVEDLPRAARLVVGTPDVPIGRYTQAMFTRVGGEFPARVREAVVSEEANVRLVRAKVELGEADAAVVYRTDVTDRVHAIDVPPRFDVPIEYWVGLVTDAEQSAGSKAFVAYLSSVEGRALLASHGFDVGGL